MTSIVQNLKQTLLSPYSFVSASIRWASKKTGGSTRNTKSSGIKKHRGWKKQDGSWVESGTLLVTQRHLQFHPGLNVGMDHNGTLYAKISGKVVVTCEIADPNWEHALIQRHYSGHENTTFFKKYLNVLPNLQRHNFILIDQV